MNFPQAVKLRVNSGLLGLVAFHGDLLQYKALIQHPFFFQIVLNPVAIRGLFRKLNIQPSGVGEIIQIQNDLRLLGNHFIQQFLQLRLLYRQPMAVSSFVHPRIPAEKGRGLAGGP